MFTKKLRFFGQILHPQWPAQPPKMGQKMAFVLHNILEVLEPMLGRPFEKESITTMIPKIW
jgi:hypothetical protein